MRSFLLIRIHYLFFYTENDTTNSIFFLIYSRIYPKLPFLQHNNTFYKVIPPSWSALSFINSITPDIERNILLSTECLTLCNSYFIVRILQFNNQFSGAINVQYKMIALGWIYIRLWDFIKDEMISSFLYVSCVKYLVKVDFF